VFFPDLPTIASAGVKDYEAYSWSGVVAPKGTPAEAVKQANAQLNKVLKDPQVIEMMNKAGQEPVAMSPEEFAAFLDNEIKKWSKTIQTAGIKPE
jgi:tripartite-type tricarboxylate transporter receptor subunit TctC